MGPRDADLLPGTLLSSDLGGPAGRIPQAQHRVTRVVAASTAAVLDGPAFDRCSPAIGDPTLPSGGELHQMHIGLGFLLETLTYNVATCPQPWDFGTDFTHLHEPSTTVMRG